MKKAILRAEVIKQVHTTNRDKLINYRGFRFYIDNPDTTVDRVVRIIFDVCKINVK